MTRAGIGAAPFGGPYAAVDAETAIATVRRAYERGRRLFDTAPLYAHGLSEQRVGRGLADMPRDEVVVETRVGRLLRADVPPVNPVFDFGYGGAMRSFEESIERLGLDRIDTLLVHDPDEHEAEPLAGAYRAARPAARRRGRLGTRRRHEPRGGARAASRGRPNSGILPDPRPGAVFDYAPARAELVERAQRLDRVWTRHGVALKAAALHFAAPPARSDPRPGTDAVKVDAHVHPWGLRELAGYEWMIAKPPIASHALESWAERMARPAEFEHVRCKVSGLVTDAHWRRWSVEDLRLYIGRVADWVGDERLISAPSGRSARSPRRTTRSCGRARMRSVSSGTRRARRSSVETRSSSTA